VGRHAGLLRTHFNAQETLTTLMLTYVATFILSYMVHGPWRDPGGMNFPQSIMFGDSALFSILLEDSRVNTSVYHDAVRRARLLAVQRAQLHALPARSRRAWRRPLRATPVFRRGRRSGSASSCPG
jgi:ABC-type uncharacterized transport system permease subunit